MKKIVSSLLLVCMLASVLLSLAGCDLFKAGIHTGTEAAKLLLANERMDEKLIGSRINTGMLGDTGTTASTTQHERSEANLTPNTPNIRMSSAHTTRSLSASGASALPLGVAESSLTHTWTSFPRYSTSLNDFAFFMENIETQIGYIAEDIANMKNNVGVTDKWVTIGYSKQMLRVYDTYDVLLAVGEYGNINVCYRYTDESAKNVYEMYSFMPPLRDGTKGEARMMCIPGERYEYMYNTSDGFMDGFIAENSRGYWINTRFGYDNVGGTPHAAFNTYIIKDGLGYSSSIDIGGGYGLYGEESSTMGYTIFDPNDQRELFKISDLYGRYKFELYLTAIRNGLVSVSSNNAYTVTNGKTYETGALDTLKTSKGVYTAVHEPEQWSGDEFTFAGGAVHAFFDEKTQNYFDFGSLDFSMAETEMSLDEACREFSDYARSLGLELYCNMETVARSLEHAVLFADGFKDSFEWNGYKMSSVENLKKARDVLQGQFDSARADYEKVKNYETSSTRQTLSGRAHFAELQTAVVGDNRFDGTSVILSGISVLTDDVDLFEVGKEYVLKVALSRLDEKGNPISVNTVPLAGTEPTGVRFGGKSITLGVSGKYEIPKNLDSGDYAAVVYIATKEDGIRVSEIQKVAFLSIKEGEIKSSAMYMRAIKKDNNLILRYEIKNRRDVVITATKASYSYDEVSRFAMIEILTYGAPYHGAVLEYANGGTIAKGATLGKGSYRMMCYLATTDGLAQSYVYLTLK